MVLVAALLAGCAAPALAQTQAEMNEDAARSFHHADAKLNDTYRRLMAKLDAAGQKKLRQAEGAWLTWRDAECALETAGSEGGSACPMLVVEGREALTKEQEARLARQLRCPEGPMACAG